MRSNVSAKMAENATTFRENVHAHLVSLVHCVKKYVRLVLMEKHANRNASAKMMVSAIHTTARANVHQV